MTERSEPIVPTVLLVGDQRSPWRLAQLERVSVRYHTPTTVRIGAGKAEASKHQTHVYCLPNDAAWEEIQAAQASLQQQIDALADGLRGRGSYASRLEQAGGLKNAPNPLSATVISAPDPDDADADYWYNNLAPRAERITVTSHTPKMLHIDRDGKPWSTAHQRDHFVCPDDAAWAQIEALHKAVEAKAQAWQQMLLHLATYQVALADGRYTRKATPMQTSMPVRVRPVSRWDETDIDSGLLARLQSAGYHWEHAKQTPDGHWHHVISARNTALLRNDQVLMRRERLEALLTPAATRPAEQYANVHAFDAALGRGDAGAPAAALALTSNVLVGVAMMDQVEARQAVEQIKTHLDSARRQLLDLYEREGWRALGYTSWRACATAEFGQSSAQIYRLLSAAQIEQAIDSPIGEIPESHLRPLGKLDSGDEQRAALDRAGEIAGSGPRTAAHVQQAVDEIKPKATPTLHPDYQHQVAADQILDKLGQWADSARPAQIQEAYAHAREIRDLTTRDRVFAQIDAAISAPAAHLAGSVAPLETRGARLGPGQPAPEPWPAPPDGWRWNRRGAPAHLIAPDGWRTADYTYPERALAEAQRRILSQPKAAPATFGVDWNIISRESYRLGATNRIAEAWIVVGNIIGILSRADSAAALTWLLTEADALAPDRLEDLADQLDDATYEALAAYRREDEPVPTLESEGIV